MNHSTVIFFWGCWLQRVIFQSCSHHETREKHECRDLPTAQLYLHAASVQLVIQNT